MQSRTIMITSLTAYMDQILVMAFLSGYPLIYAMVYFIAGTQSKKSNDLLIRMVSLLPLAYAFTATLFLALVLKNMFPDYSLTNISIQFKDVYIKIWGILAVLFWIPALNKRPVFSLLHSLVIFSLLLKDLFVSMTSSVSSDHIKNDMKVYTDSLLLNIGSFALILFVHFLFTKFRNSKKSSLN